MKTKPQIIVGLDMSANKKDQGVAVGEIWPGGRIELVKVGNGWIFAQILNDYKPTLLAIDAPLGWPVAMRAALCGHHVGENITIPPDKVFHRATDKFIKDKIGKKPFEVGAAWIARTAYAACKLLGKQEIPVLLKPGIPKCLSAIEVYPAATLLAYGWEREMLAQKMSTKEKERVRRQEKIDFLKEQSVVFHDMVEQKVLDNNHFCDACVCLLAARDFLRGECYEPQGGILETDVEIEGWIWVKERDGNA